jgi:hypothetical protein
METLAANGGVIKFNFGIDLETFTWLEPCPAIAMFDRNGRRHNKNPTSAAKLPDAGAVDGLDNRQAAAIQNWRLAAVYFDDGIVNAKPGKGGHYVLNRFQTDAIIIDDAGAQPRLANGVGAGGNGLAAFGNIDAAEQNAAIGGGGVDGDADEPTGMKAYTIEGNGSGDRGLHGRLQCILHRRDLP